MMIATVNAFHPAALNRTAYPHATMTEKTMAEGFAVMKVDLSRFLANRKWNVGLKIITQRFVQSARFVRPGMKPRRARKAASASFLVVKNVEL